MKLKLLPSIQDFGLGFDERVGGKINCILKLRGCISVRHSCVPGGQQSAGRSDVQQYRS